MIFISGNTYLSVTRGRTYRLLFQRVYETQVDAHFQLYLNYVEYLKAAGALSEVKK